MRNNPYKNMIKVLTPKKNDRLVIKHVGKTYYMTETHLVFRFSEMCYETYFHDEKPTVFPIIDDGVCISNGAPCDMSLEKLFDDHMPGHVYEAYMTDIIKVIKGDLARMYLISDASGIYVPMLINENFHAAYCDLNITLKCSGNNIQPLCLYHEDGELFGIVCPINYYDGNLKKHGAALATLAEIDILSSKRHIA